mmetsp:Transcript_31205/g.72220  ORF Transcript_31205/g.72220 Transcript_31205/m.72220 type:complete len:210 (-) Transcript_31205:153-782(-)
MAGARLADAHCLRVRRALARAGRCRLPRLELHVALGPPQQVARELPTGRGHVALSRVIKADSIREGRSQCTVVLDTAAHRVLIGRRRRGLISRFVLLVLILGHAVVNVNDGLRLGSLGVRQVDQLLNGFVVVAKYPAPHGRVCVGHNVRTGLFRGGCGRIGRVYNCSHDWSKTDGLWRRGSSARAYCEKDRTAEEAYSQASEFEDGAVR